jgi:pyrroloquinoline quinone (PQQ) biosynthesis protein C
VRKNIEEMGKYVTELIIEAENDDKVLDTVNKPYTILYDTNLDRLNQAINILAVKRGYRVVNVSNSTAYWTACLEKMESKQ